MRLGTLFLPLQPPFIYSLQTKVACREESGNSLRARQQHRLAVEQQNGTLSVEFHLLKGEAQGGHGSHLQVLSWPHNTNLCILHLLSSSPSTCPFAEPLSADLSQEATLKHCAPFLSCSTLARSSPPWPPSAPRPLASQQQERLVTALMASSASNTSTVAFRKCFGTEVNCICVTWRGCYILNMENMVTFFKR